VVVRLALRDNDCDHPARAVDSTQVIRADRGLGVHRVVLAISSIGLRDVVTPTLFVGSLYGELDPPKISGDDLS
jgi:hypothetical protein